MRNNQPKRHAQQKKKNTYILKISGLLITPGIFAMCKSTPLPVIVKNGEQTQSASGWMAATSFPNPGALHMQMEYKFLEPYMGEKMASTIVEYLDKETGKPVLMLFPTTCYIFDGYENNYMEHLNHASRRDLQYQMHKRELLIDAASKARQQVR